MRSVWRQVVLACLLAWGAEATCAQAAPDSDAEPATAVVPTTASDTRDTAHLPTGKELMEQSREMARLAQELEKIRIADRAAGRPRREYITTSTRAPVWASYMRTFSERVDRAGTSLYASASHPRGGRVIVTAVIRRDGSLVGVARQDTSGDPVLDSLAVAAVRAAAPFPPLPELDPDAPVEELYLTRTLDFVPASAPTVPTLRIH
jgi:protein TonB